MKKSTALAVMMLLLLTTGAQSDNVPVRAEDATTGVSASEFIGPDGRIDINAVRQSGYEGTVDLEDFDVTIDPSTGQPLLRPTVAAETDSDPDDIYWSPLGLGTDGRVWALTVYDRNLIAGGDFTTADGVAANHIASWDGSSWSPLGSRPPLDPGCDDRVVALTVYDGKLIAGGYFTTAGGVVANYIASWDGGHWSPLGSGMNGSVRALTVYDGKLIAGGGFTTAGGVAASCIASWDGSNWSALGLGVGAPFSPLVRALTIYNGELVVGGVFSEAGGVECSCMATWDGSDWSPIWSRPVNALTVYDGYLIYAGAMIAPGDLGGFIHATNLSDDWFELVNVGTESLYPDVLTVYDGKLIAGGEFPGINGVLANNIAFWDGSTWFPLGSGTDAWVWAMTVYEGELMVGGAFTMAGDKAAAYLAAWARCSCQVPGDANHDGILDLLDLQFLRDYLHKDGPEPPCFEEADVDGDGEITTEDLSCLARYLYSTGNPCVFVPCPE